MTSFSNFPLRGAYPYLLWTWFNQFCCQRCSTSRSARSRSTPRWISRRWIRVGEPFCHFKWLCTLEFWASTPACTWYGTGQRKRSVSHSNTAIIFKNNKRSILESDLAMPKFALKVYSRRFLYTWYILQRYFLLLTSLYTCLMWNKSIFGFIDNFY